MEDINILKSRISDKIDELYRNDKIFTLSLIIEGGHNQMDTVSKKLRSVRKLYRWLYLPGAILFGSLVFIAGFLQVFDIKLFNWDKAGLTIMFAIIFIMNAWMYKCLIERLKMMQFLIELKNGIE